MISHQYGNYQKYYNPNPIQKHLIERFLRTISLLVKQTSALVLADIGCAEGFLPRYLRKLHPQIRFTGIDIDRSALKRGKELNPWFPATQANIYEMPYKSNAFDLVLCLEVLEHLERPDRAVAELKRITRRYCLFSVPREPFFRMANFLRGKNLTRLGNDVDHINHWNKASFIKFMKGFDLRIVDMKTSFPWLISLTELDHELEKIQS